MAVQTPVCGRVLSNSTTDSVIRVCNDFGVGLAHRPFSGVMLRVDRDGLGPYSFKRDLDIMRCDPIIHPAWEDDVGLPNIDWLQRYDTYAWDQFIFGFTTVDQYVRWFHTPTIRNELGQRGFKLKLMKSPRVYASKRQCLFVPGFEARIKEYLPTVVDTHPAVDDEIRDIQYAHQTE